MFYKQKEVLSKPMSMSDRKSFPALDIFSPSKDKCWEAVHANWLLLVIISGKLINDLR